MASERAIFESILDKAYAVNHHLAAPLSGQRAAYLQHLGEQGRTRKALKDTAALLLHVSRVLSLDEQKILNPIEIRRGASTWCTEELPHRRSPTKKSAERFYTVANGFLVFHGLKAKSDPLSCSFDPIFFQFQNFLISKGYQPTTMRSIAPPVRTFLFWMFEQQMHPSSMRIEDIEMYLSQGVSAFRWRPRTLAGKCQALRSFLGFLESRGLCKAGLSKAVLNPVIRSRDRAISVPRWADVRRMIQMTGDASAYGSRARAILLLCCVYGLRSSEITKLTVDSFDWQRECFGLQRAKNGYWQRFPITQELGQAILHYIRCHRPTSSCNTLFVTLLPPYRPLQNLGSIVQKQMRFANMKTTSFGPHSLRHACATELLRRGTSLQNIANLLGHRDLRSVSVYARQDSESLRLVANFSLDGIV